MFVPFVGAEMRRGQLADSDWREAVCRWGVIPVMMTGRYSRHTLSSLPIKLPRPSRMWPFPVLLRSRVVLAQWCGMFISHHRGSKKKKKKKMGLNLALRPWEGNVFISKAINQTAKRHSQASNTLPVSTFIINSSQWWKLTGISTYGLTEVHVVVF